MKTLGKNDRTGELIVALLPQEFECLRRVAEAVNALPGFYPSRVDLPDGDWSAAFQAMAVWAEAQFKVRDLAMVLDDCRRALGELDVGVTSYVGALYPEPLVEE